MLDDWLALCTAAARPALPQDWWTAWSLAPATLALLVPLLGHAAAPPRRSGLAAGSARAWRMAGLSLLALALLSPLCRLAATLAWAHMLQLMLAIAGAGLLAAGWRRPRAGPAALAAAVAGHGALLWLWHLPVVYAAVLTQPVLHVATYALLVLSAFWFWQAVRGALPDGPPWAGLMALLVTMAHTGLLGALLTFAPAALYPLHAAGARAWGLDPLQDQQLAGLLMWVPAGLVYLLAGAALLGRWLRGPRAAPQAR